MKALVTKNLGKKYDIYRRPIHRLVELATLGKKRLHTDFWALRNIDLDVEKGQTLGILGPNGAGKSTLLKLLTGTSFPSEGSIELNGRVTGLLELGSGFHPEFTGRDNAIMSCSLLGMTKSQIHAKIDDIADFSEIGPFFDQPVKTYSSGMYMRLGFSVAASLDPDILVVDEALAVGDEYFVGKCLQKFADLRRKGRTIILVSHLIKNIRLLCDQAVLLDSGRLIDRGDPDKLCDQYLISVADKANRAAQSRRAPGQTPAPGTLEIDFTQTQILDKDEKTAELLMPGHPFTIRANYTVNADTDHLMFGLDICRENGMKIIMHFPLFAHGLQRDWKTIPDLYSLIPPKKKGQTGTVTCRFDHMPLLGDTYFVHFWAVELKPNQTPRNIPALAPRKYFTVVQPAGEVECLLYTKATWQDTPH
jgi:ABC-type polysaccharide/polyol phosphate transport system ATPase subunit